MQKITPFLWFDGKAEEAINFYVSIFKNSKIVSANRFQLDGQEFLVLNGGPQFTFSPAVSFFVNCETQQEVDELWEKLSEGGERKMRLAKRQIWPVMASHSLCFRGDVA
jgi:predicted 3-demethylubiquinone-9 3-methyltransferase (glyoxalase superfamily)